MKNRPLVAIVMGSHSDKEVMDECANALRELAIPYEVTVSSAHRSPEATRDYAIRARERGIEVIVAGAGWAAHLAGVLASHTVLPIIGVPIDSSPLRGMDALLSTVQMPPGVPVATMAIGRGGAVNAAVFAAQILALKYPDIAQRLDEHREGLKARARGGSVG
ncbi:MAG: 5-(carboxyamino)imidazole ribonucleotide mutase [Deltaproteobacteria bacterium]|nr:5-(carboxyamino)imidazole ribonucleotide mutase [Deltaproteobacteria bacterium]RLB27901.1 MAG: 5-(carboxyamino)imidazole ribonucleotide mutase [Deltaproteobacteria bacterium]